jgi:hypothetical protein
MVEM